MAISSIATHQWPKFKLDLKPLLFGVLRCLRCFDHAAAVEPARLTVIAFPRALSAGILEWLFKAYSIDILVASSTLVNHALVFVSA
jgi:hypothetical protein